jgi:hypothetical protein
MTTSSVSSTTTSTQLVAANTSRSGLVIVNTDANRLYLLMGSGTAASTPGNFTEYLDENDVAHLDGEEAERAWQGIWVADGAGAASITETLTEALAGAGTTSILGIIQETAPRLGLEVPDTVFSSTERTQIELKRVVNATLDMIVRAHRWQKLVQRATYSGDGSTTDFDLPADYGWMPDDQRIWSTTGQRTFLKCQSLDDWLALDVRNFNPGDNAWIIYGQQLHFTPALDDGEDAQHFYQSTAAVQPASGTAKSTFTLDTDTFRLDDELLRLGLIYRWKQYKGLPYAEFMNDYEILKEKLIGRDKGATMLRQGKFRMPRDAAFAYPLNVPGGT